MRCSRRVDGASGSASCLMWRVHVNQTDAVLPNPSQVAGSVETRRVEESVGRRRQRDQTGRESWIRPDLWRRMPLSEGHQSLQSRELESQLSQ
jgi:hypothetical protein